MQQKKQRVDEEADEDPETIPTVKKAKVKSSIDFGVDRSRRESTQLKTTETNEALLKQSKEKVKMKPVTRTIKTMFNQKDLLLEGLDTEVLIFTLFLIPSCHLINDRQRMRSGCKIKSKCKTRKLSLIESRSPLHQRILSSSVRREAVSIRSLLLAPSRCLQYFLDRNHPLLSRRYYFLSLK